jgi:hypothetical protein
MSSFAPSEDYECQVFVRWLDSKKLKFSHLPLETPCTAIQSARLKKMGVRKGVPDYLIVVGSKLVFVEMKKVGGRVSPEQVAWLKTLATVGGVYTYVCYGAEDAIARVEYHCANDNRLTD